MENALIHIAFEHSYVLGWKKEGDALTLFLEVMLTEQHPLFEPFDTKQFVGCYKLAIWRFTGVTQVGGIEKSLHQAVWTALGEYQDMAEINTVELFDQYVEIDANEVTISFQFNENRFKILTEKRFTAWES